EAFDPSIGVQLLAAIEHIFVVEGTDRIASKSLQEALVDDVTAPWASYGRGGKPITENGIARPLKAYTVRPRTIRLLAGGTAKGYMRAWLDDAFQRHLTPLSAHPPFATVTSSQVNLFNGLEEKQTVTPDLLVTDQNPHNPLKEKSCDGVTDENVPQAKKD